jgi:hypothetical protein
MTSQGSGNVQVNNDQFYYNFRQFYNYKKINKFANPCVGLSTSGYHACPKCGPSLVALRPPHLKRVIYENHGRFLPLMHPRYQPSQNGVSPMSMSMKDWKELWVQANGVAIPRKSRYINRSLNCLLLAASLPCICRVQIYPVSRVVAAKLPQSLTRS